jgi:hypothetical protein
LGERGKNELPFCLSGEWPLKPGTCVFGDTVRYVNWQFEYRFKLDIQPGRMVKVDGSASRL